MENLFKRKFIYFLFTILFAFTAIVITGCDNEDDIDPEPIAVSYVSIYHASPDAPPVDIVMETNQINFYPLRYADYIGYLNFLSGERDMRVSPDGASNVVIDTTFTFVEGEAYSLFYVNQLDNIEAFLVEDELVTPEAGFSAIRFAHLSPDGSEIDLERIVGDDRSIIAENNTFQQVTDFMEVESGIQSYEIRSAETDEVLLSIPEINLIQGRVYTIIARGFSTPPPGNSNNLSADIVINN